MVGGILHSTPQGVKLRIFVSVKSQVVEQEIPPTHFFFELWAPPHRYATLARLTTHFFFGSHQGVCCFSGGCQAPPCFGGTPPYPSYGKVAHSCGPHAYCSLDKKDVACTEHMEMGTAALAQAKGRHNAQGPSHEHLWAPLGKQERLKSPSANQTWHLDPNPLSYLVPH